MSSKTVPNQMYSVVQLPTEEEEEMYEKGHSVQNIATIGTYELARLARQSPRYLQIWCRKLYVENVMRNNNFTSDKIVHIK